ncbi:hypothetical protein VTL71DRAFT_6859 [Oculimacula yallundae]|uniref:Ketoreductase domain-containing protein n=1 Tax=Oculimacula yallundae TaxID=86028 RepID=A0ABR4BV44_9HELO
MTYETMTASQVVLTPFSLSGKVALVTGGSRGLGLYAASAILLAGARKVILVARKTEGPTGLNQAVEQLNSLPVDGNAEAHVADISKESEIKRVLEAIGKTETAIHILVANAGATWGGPFADSPDASSAKVLDLNVRGVFNLVRLMITPLTKEATSSDPARVIIVGSTAGINVPHIGEHGTIMYSASKAAAHHMARNLALELGPRHITTNVIAPGYFPTKLAGGIIGIMGGEEELGKVNPLGRLGKREDFQGAVVYLCSLAGAYVNGVILPLDGGAHLGTRSNPKI